MGSRLADRVARVEMEMGDPGAPEDPGCVAARERLAEFWNFEMEDGERVVYEPPPAAHHRFLIGKLEAVERGEIKRLMVFMPPGSAKSSYASIGFPPWYLGRNPRHNVIGGSHTGDLAEHFGRRTRNIVSSEAYRRIFGWGLNPESKSVKRWEPESGGEYYASGVGGSVTGRRADLIIIDDPVKGREDADSLRIRDKTWDWYTNDLRTRLKPGGAIILIQTRWHEDDLSGRILPEKYEGQSGRIEARDGEIWEVVCFPAQAEAEDVLGREPGEWLWPEWFRPEELEQQRRTLGERGWAALYQQRPSPETGLYFKREWIQYYDKAPPLDHMRIYAASDYAVTEGGGDYTVHGIFGVAPDERIYVLDWWRQQTSSDKWVEAFCDLAEKWQPIGWAEENGQILKSIGPFLKKRMQEMGVYTARFQFTSSTDKPSRAQSIRGRMAQGMLFFPRNAPYTPALVSELMTFPAGTNDDQVDTLSLIGRVLPQLAGGRVPKDPEKVWREPTINELFEIQEREQGYAEPTRRRI